MAKHLMSTNTPGSDACVNGWIVAVVERYCSVAIVAIIPPKNLRTIYRGIKVGLIEYNIKRFQLFKLVWWHENVILLDCIVVVMKQIIYTLQHIVACYPVKLMSRMPTLLWIMAYLSHRAPSAKDLIAKIEYYFLEASK